MIFSCKADDFLKAMLYRASHEFSHIPWKMLVFCQRKKGEGRVKSNFLTKKNWWNSIFSYENFLTKTLINKIIIIINNTLWNRIIKGVKGEGAIIVCLTDDHMH